MAPEQGFSSEELRKKRIGVLLGGLSGEREVSLETGRAAVAALQERGLDAVAIDVHGERWGQDLAARLVAERIDVAFIGLHGRFGEDGCVQGLLECLRIPYTGAGVLSSSMAMDKVVTKRLADAAGIATAPWAFPATLEALAPPVVLKPRREGSSLGVTIARDHDALRARLAAEDAAELLVERYVPGRELSVAVLGDGDAAQGLGVIEIQPAQGFYDYDAKYARADTSYVVDPALPAAVREQLLAAALRTHRLLECSGVTRVDFRWDGAGVPLLLELNTLPGLTSHSLVPKIAAARGMSYGELVERIAAEARLKA